MGAILLGIGPLDERVGPLTPGRLYLFTGGPGCGKTVAALHFAGRGLQDGDRVGILSQAHAPDLVQQAAYMGLDLVPALRSGQCVLLGFQRDFARRFSRSVDYGPVFDELASALAGPDGSKVARLVIDSAAPFWQVRDPGLAATRLVEWLESYGATTVVTVARETAAGVEPHLDWLTQRAFGLFHFEFRPDGRRQIVVRKLVPPREVTGPVTFEIRPGVGIAPPSESARRRADDLPPDARRRLLLLDLAGACPADLRAQLAAAYELRVCSDPVETIPELLETRFGAVVIVLDRRTLDAAVRVCRQVRRVASAPPILLASADPLRASDRSAGLLAGADDFVTGALNAEEVGARLAALMRRGRSAAAAAVPEREWPRQARDEAGRIRAMTPDEFRASVAAQLESGAPGPFSVLLLPAGPRVGDRSVAERLLKEVRTDAGDLVAGGDGRVLVFLRGAAGREARQFLARLSRRLGPSGVAVAEGAQVLTYPAEASEIRELLASP